MSLVPILLGTAGHIDHGKTSLVHSLTGIDTDRLKVEKERGITTELGFAHLDLGGRRYGFVDVPGHERFIRAMVAGATGLDLVCLVIAADEGIMPQTREHLDICQLLGVRAGFVALTKADMVDADWLALVQEDVRAGLAGTFLESTAIIPFSAKTGSGRDRILAEIERLAGTLEPRGVAGAFRLPVDRVFTIKGFGTVVTGTIFDGEVRTKDDVEILPTGRTGKVRGLQVHGNEVELARAGMRCAVNLGGLAVNEIRRGDVLSHPGQLAPSHIIDVRLHYLKTSREPLKNRQRVIIHHGTTQVLGAVTLLEGESLNPGQHGLAQLRIDRDTPLCAIPGDRFLIRGFVPQAHYGTTLGGGEILRVQAAKLRVRDADTTALAELEGADLAARIVHEVGRAGHRGLRSDEIGQRVGIAAAEVAARIEPLLAEGTLVRAAHASGSEVIIGPEAIARLEKLATDRVAEHASTHPTEPGMPRAELREKLPQAVPAAVFELVIDALARRHAIEVDGALVRKPAPKLELSPVAIDLERRFRDWGVTPPRPGELAAEVGLSRAAADEASKELIRAGLVVRVKHDLFVHAEAIAALRADLESHLNAHGAITPAEWKTITGASRKYSIPLGEYFDEQKLTLRVGDVRKRRG